MNQLRDMFTVLVAAIYHLGMVAGAAYLVYWKDASAWVFAIPLLMAMSFKTKDESKDKKNFSQPEKS